MVAVPGGRHAPPSKSDTWAATTGLQLDQVLANRVEHGLVPAVEAELVEDVADVVLDRVLRDVQLIADFTAGLTAGDQLENFEFTARQGGFAGLEELLMRMARKC